MARITVEDCLEKIPNRFQLVLAATYRARMLSQGHTPKIDSRNKPAVTALREIAAGKVGGYIARTPVTDLGPHIARMEGFHRRYMVSNKVLRISVPFFLLFTQVCHRTLQ